ncbi:MAG: lysophospholipid acyltransferase family protein [Chloroflexi bacterium]|nr:lysophospholipid acyltransferase family protein [Chloroflexota bacterium]
MIYWVHVMGTVLMRFVPVSIAYRLVGWCTPIALALFARGYLRRATDNMHQVLGPQADPREAARLTRAAFANYARYMIDLVRLPHLDTSEFVHNVRVEGWEHVDAAYRVGKGVVFATGHIGNWDMAGAAFAARGRPVSALVETLKPERWNERVQRTRIAAGVKAIPIENGPREMLAALRKQEGLAVLVDRPMEADGVPVTFFGRGTRVPGGAATLALRTGSPVVPAALVRDPRGNGYVALIGPPIVGERGDDVSVMMQGIMSWLEGIIRRYPDQWFMFRHMWPQERGLNADAFP